MTDRDLPSFCHKPQGTNATKTDDVVQISIMYTQNIRHSVCSAPRRLHGEGYGRDFLTDTCCMLCSSCLHC